jgi:dienelactone hydrolase
MRLRRSTRLGLVAASTPLAAAGVTAAREVASAAMARSQGVTMRGDVPVPEPSVGLGVAAALDALVSGPMPLLSSLGSPEHYAAASAELDAAVGYYRDAGWLDDPGRRHRRPSEPDDVQLAPPQGRSRVEVASFESGWRPDTGEPGAERWLSFDANEPVPVRLLRHAGAPRPWLVAVHGQGMGRPSDVKMLRVRHLHEELGINVALPVLPLHGPRACGFTPVAQFASNVFATNNVLGLTQAVWDIRRVLQWLRGDQRAPAVGLLGVSLGAYVINLLSTLEADLACLVAVVPTSDLAASMREAAPVTPAKRRLHRLVHDDRSALVHRVVSPLAARCLVPHERRHIVAGQVDRIAPPRGAAQVWRHWDEPSIAWRPRGHVTAWRGAEYDDHIASVLVSCGLRHWS